MRKNKVPRFIFLRSKNSLPIRKKLKKRLQLVDSLLPQKKPLNLNMEKEEKRIHNIFFKSEQKKNNKQNMFSRSNINRKKSQRQLISTKPLQKKQNKKRKNFKILNEKLNIKKKYDKNHLKKKKEIPKQNNAHVVIAHYNEEIDWISKLKYNFTLISRYGLEKETPPNKGNEASSYLEYIIKNYYKLKEYTIFVHGHETAYHHETPIQDKINNLNFDKPYYNINELPIQMHGKCKNNFIKIIEDLILKREIKDSYLLRPCAMFYVHRDMILRNSLDFYKILYRYLMESTEESYYTGRYFEYTWHIIFTHQDDDTL